MATQNFLLRASLREILPPEGRPPAARHATAQRPAGTTATHSPAAILGSRKSPGIYRMPPPPALAAPAGTLPFSPGPAAVLCRAAPRQPRAILRPRAASRGTRIRPAP